MQNLQLTNILFIVLLRVSPVLQDYSQIPTHPSASVRMLHLQFKLSKQESDFFQGDLRVWEAQNLCTETPHTVACKESTSHRSCSYGAYGII